MRGKVWFYCWGDGIILGNNTLDKLELGGNQEMKILISTGALVVEKDYNDFELLKEIVPQLTCDGIEFMMYRRWYNQIERLVQVLKELNIDIPVMHFDKHIGEEIANEEIEVALEHFEINCQIAKNIGATKAVLHLWNGRISDQKIDINIAAYGRLRNISEKYGIQLLIENVVCNTYNPFCNWNWLIEKYPDVLYIFDTKMAAFHCQLDGIYDFDKIDHIRHYHINDYNGGYMDWDSLLGQVLPVGKGNIDFERFFKFIKNTGYNDTLTLESTAQDKNGNIDIEMLNNQVKKIQRMLGMN